MWVPLQKSMSLLANDVVDGLVHSCRLEEEQLSYGEVSVPASRGGKSVKFRDVIFI